MSNIYNIDAAALYIGDAEPDKAHFLDINTIQIPSLEEATKEIKPGGGIVGLNMRTKSFKPLTFGFNLVGIQPKVMNFIAKEQREKYTMRGNLYDLRRQKDLPFVGVCEGRMMKRDIKEFKKEGDTETEYEINEIVTWKLHIDGKEEEYFDFFAGPSGIRINGNKRFNKVARNLGLGA